MVGLMSTAPKCSRAKFASHYVCAFSTGGGENGSDVLREIEVAFYRVIVDLSAS